MSAASRVLIQANATYFPSTLWTDTSLARTFIGNVDPSTISGIAMGLGDVWRSTGAAAPTPPLPPTPDPTTRGAATLGTTSYTPPTGAVYVDPAAGSDTAAGTIAAPWKTVQHAVNTVASGGWVAVRAGVVREEINLSGGTKSVTIAAYPGEVVWFDGSVQVTAWTAGSGVWTTPYAYNFEHSASFTPGKSDITVNPLYPMAAYPDQVFVDGVQQLQVSGTPTAGQFSVNTTTQLLTIGTNPAGHTVLVSTLQRAFFIGTSGYVNLYGFGVRNYATSLTLQGTVYYGGSHPAASLIENVIVQDCAGQGVSINPPSGIVVNHCTSNRNGMTGFHANGANNVQFTNNHAEGNNTQNWKSVSAGGIKVTSLSSGWKIDSNDIVNNLCNGIWTDGNCYNGFITRNTATGNYSIPSSQGWYGIHCEESDTNVIAGNTVGGSKFNITCLVTGRVRIVNNTILPTKVDTTAQPPPSDILIMRDGRNGTGPVGAACPWSTVGIVVQNNIFPAPASNGYSIQVWDSVTANNTPGSAMCSDIEGNVLPGGGSGNLVRWGQSTVYTSMAAFNTGTGNSWANPASTADPTAAVPLAADIASALGVATGSRFFGATDTYDYRTWTYGSYGAYEPTTATTGPAAAGMPLASLVTYPATGGPAGNVSGQTLTITTPNIHLDGYYFPYRVVPAAANITITRSKFGGQATAQNSTVTAIVDCSNSSVVNFTAADCLFVPTAPSPWIDCIVGHDYTIARCEGYNTCDFAGGYNQNNSNGPVNVYILQCYAHDLGYWLGTDWPGGVGHTGDTTPATHNDIYQAQGGSVHVLLGNSMWGYCATSVGFPHHSPYYPVVTGQVVTCSPNVNGTITGMNVQHNFVHGGSRGFISIDGSFGGDNLGTWSNNTFFEDTHSGTDIQVANNMTLTATGNVTNTGAPVSVTFVAPSVG